MAYSIPERFSIDNSSLPQQLRHWGIAILCLLRERPMHPYEMRRIMKIRHKDDRLDLKPGSLYNAVSWLTEKGFIEAVKTDRKGRRPQRTTYSILPAGQSRLADWIGEMLCEVRREVSSFSVGLDHLVHLSPKQAIERLKGRCDALDVEISRLGTSLQDLINRVGRINLVEVEYDLALFRAQREWLGRLIEDLRSGRLQWNTEQILEAVRTATKSACV